MKRSLICAVLAGLTLHAFPARAWDGVGHRVIAGIAAGSLTPAAKSQVEDLLGGDAYTAMTDASSWADEIRSKRPETARWHFVEIPTSSSGYDARRDCRHDDCLVAQIEERARILADRSSSKPVRAEALLFLIHLVGDIHQPLHTANNHDSDGSKTLVLIRDRKVNLHAVWDGYLVQPLGRSPKEITARLEHAITPNERRQWERGTPADWANESFQIALKEAYKKAIMGRDSNAFTLPPDYVKDDSQIAAIQLERAGVRLAMVLNTALK